MAVTAHLVDKGLHLQERTQWRMSHISYRNYHMEQDKMISEHANLLTIEGVTSEASLQNLKKKDRQR